jgi:hypothetical protein
MNFLVDHAWIELALVGLFILVTYASATKHTVPDIRPVTGREALRPPASGPLEAGLINLGYEHVGDYDASATDQVEMKIQVYLSPDRLCTAVIANVKSAAQTFSLVEFNTDLSPHGNITTSGSKYPNTFYYPPDKMVAKVPWKTSVAEMAALHTLLCETAREDQFVPVRMDPGRIRECVVAEMRRDYEYQVKCGRMTEVSPDVYRSTLKGTFIAVPLIWSKMVHGFIHNLYHPSNETFCRRLRGRLKKARNMREHYGLS